MKKVGIFYGSSSGDTEFVAEQIQKELGGKESADVKNIVMAQKEDLEKYKNLIFGTSTWREAGLQYDWEFYQDILDETDFSGKKVALFGLGDQLNYPGNFVDAMRILYDKVKQNNGEIAGKVSASGYNFKRSKALVDDHFVGLPIDEDNENNKTRGRIKRWCEQLQKAFH
ncbi:MAG: flavodoxin [Bacteroidales bacterium]